MSNYTFEIREIINNINIFENINYNLYNNDYKKEFENKFINHFFYREIGFETIGRFVKNLETTLNDIYPYYKHLYETMTYEYNPIENYNLNEVITEDKNKSSEYTNSLKGQSEDNLNITGKEKVTEYNTPISSASCKPSNITDSTNSNFTNNTNSNSTNTNGKQSSKGQNKSTRNTYGNIGVQTTQDMIKKERDIILNIDMLMFEELDNLFMQIW